MRIVRAIISIALTTMTLVAGDERQQSEILPGAAFPSPDGKFTAKCDGGGVLPATDSITVIDNKTGKSTRNEINPPLYSLRWTGDSKTIVNIEHIAGGTVSSVIHLTNGLWKYYRIDPGEGDHYQVIREIVSDNTIELTYKVNIKPHSGSNGRLYIYSFSFDPETMEKANEKRDDVDPDTYRRLRLK